MKYELSEYINSITMTKENLCRGDDEATKGYPSFVVNRCMSYHQSLIHISNELNGHYVPNLDHYEFLLHIIPKGKRFAKWAKSVNDENTPLIAKYYEVSQKRAREIMELLTESQIEEIKSYFSEGGVEKKRGKK